MSERRKDGRKEGRMEEPSIYMEVESRKMVFQLQREYIPLHPMSQRLCLVSHAVASGHTVFDLSVRATSKMKDGQMKGTARAILVKWQCSFVNPRMLTVFVCNSTDWQTEQPNLKPHRHTAPEFKPVWCVAPFDLASCNFSTLRICPGSNSL